MYSMLRYYRYDKDMASFEPTTLADKYILYVTSEILYESLRGSKATALDSEIIKALHSSNYVLVPFRAVDGQNILLEYESLSESCNNSVQKHIFRG